MVGPANGSITTWLSGESERPTAAPEPGIVLFSTLLLRIGTATGRSGLLLFACALVVFGSASPIIAVLESAYGCTVETALKRVFIIEASSGSRMGEELSREI